MIDTLLNFAPLEELARALRLPDLSNEQRLSLSGPLAQRYLARENFAEAKKCMTPAEWSLVAAALEEETAAATKASAAGEKAVRSAKVGDAWEKARGKLLREPLDSAEMRAAAFKDQAHLAGKFRAGNARALGFAVDEELQNRDELEHARTWWTRAANAAPGTALAAHCLWQALESIPRIASAGAVAEGQLAQSGAAKNSREIYERLRRECPSSPEVRRLAAYSSFPPASKNEDETFVQDEFESRTSSDAAPNGYPCGDFDAFENPDTRWREQSNAEKTWTSIIQSISLLPQQANEETPAQMRERIESLLARAREAYTDVDYAIYLNLLEDLSLLLNTAQITDEAMRIYLPLRVGWLRFAYSGAGTDYHPSHAPSDDLATAEARWKKDVAAARANPALQSLLDFVDFLPIALVAHKRIFLPVEDFDKDGEPFTYPSRDYPQLEKLTREFLSKYPHSAKREAAALLLARAVSGQSRPYILNYGVDRTDQNVGNWYDMVEHRARTFQREPFRPAQVRAALDAYDHEFPHGRYAAEIRNLRGGLAWRMREWPAALDLTLAQLDDATHRDLRPEAAMRLASIFAQMGNAQDRANILDAVRARPAAVSLLQEFLSKAALYRTHPLRYFGDYLGQQLGFRPTYESASTL